MRDQDRSAEGVENLEERRRVMLRLTNVDVSERSLDKAAFGGQEVDRRRIAFVRAARMRLACNVISASRMPFIGRERTTHSMREAQDGVLGNVREDELVFGVLCTRVSRDPLNDERRRGTASSYGSWKA